MKKLVTLFEVNSIEFLKNYCDGFIIGQDKVSTRLTRSFSSEEIVIASNMAKDAQKEVYILMNRILHDKDEHHYEDFIKSVDSEAITGYIIADIGVLSIAKKLNILHKMVYNPETLLANVFDVHYYHEQGIKGVFLAKEIILEDIIEIGKNRPYPLFMYIHGYLDMFYSKRQLVNAYFENKNLPNPYHDKRNLSVVEEKRPEFRYKALEDEAGTHIFRENVFCGLPYVDELSNSVDYIVFDTIFHDDQYTLEILKYYQEPSEEAKAQILDNYKEKWDTGFLFKKTVYKPKKVLK